MWLEVPLITKARVLAALGSDQSLSSASDLLETIRERSVAWRFDCHTIEVAVLHALVMEKQGRSGDADRALSETVSLARPGGWVRPFVEAGPEMAAMLGRRVSIRDEEDFVRSVLAGLSTSSAVTPKKSPPGPTTALAVIDKSESSIPSLRPALDTLTDREFDILKLLHERLYNKEIAAKLNISTHTVNYHLKNIYSKLDVTSRRQAVNRAIELGILKTAT